MDKYALESFKQKAKSLEIELENDGHLPYDKAIIAYLMLMNNIDSAQTFLITEMKANDLIKQAEALLRENDDENSDNKNYHLYLLKREEQERMNKMARDEAWSELHANPPENWREKWENRLKVSRYDTRDQAEKGREKLKEKYPEPLEIDLHVKDGYVVYSVLRSRM